MDNNTKYLRELKSLREKFNLEIEKEREEFFYGFFSLAVRWQDQLTDRQDMFRPEEIDWILIEYAKSIYPHVFGSDRLSDFVSSTGYKDQFEPNVDKDGKPSPSRTTALNFRYRINFEATSSLFKIYNRFDVNYTDEKTGLTHFHAACSSGCDDVVEKFLNFGQDPNLVVPNTGNSTLHLALSQGHKGVIKLLLRGGASPNLANAKGQTALHVICCGKSDDDELAKIIFDEAHQGIKVDAQDNKYSMTPLNHAVLRGHKKLTELLLRRGANPNIACKPGLTPLHICRYRKEPHDHAMAELLFEICDEIHQTLSVNAQNIKGGTPLHMALSAPGHEKLAASLLRRGADPNVANEEGRTPLHICSKRRNADLVKMLFKISEEKGHAVQVDVLDKNGSTPLQLAVENLYPDVVDVLLDRGADLSSFVFPTEIYHAENPKWNKRQLFEFKLESLSGILAAVESLEKRGYKLDRSGAQTIVKLFAKHGLMSQRSLNPINYWFGPEFTKKTKEIMITPSVSLFDLTQLRPAEAVPKQLLTYRDYFEFARSEKLKELSVRNFPNFAMDLCEILSRGFSYRRRLEFFLELTHYQLPILCCKKIIGLLDVEDLWHISLATTDHSQDRVL